MIRTIVVPTFAEIFPGWSPVAHQVALQAVQPHTRITADVIRRFDGPPPPPPRVTGRFPHLPIPTADRRIAHAVACNRSTIHTRHSLLVPLAFDSLFTVREAITPWLAPLEHGDWRSQMLKNIKPNLMALQRLILCELTVAGYGLKVELDSSSRLQEFARQWDAEFSRMCRDVARNTPTWGPNPRASERPLKRCDSRLIRLWHIQLLDVALQINLPPLLALVDTILMKFPLALDAEVSTHGSHGRPSE